MEKYYSIEHIRRGNKLNKKEYLTPKKKTKMAVLKPGPWVKDKRVRRARFEKYLPPEDDFWGPEYDEVYNDEYIKFTQWLVSNRSIPPCLSFSCV